MAEWLSSLSRKNSQKYCQTPFLAGKIGYRDSSLRSLRLPAVAQGRQDRREAFKVGIMEFLFLLRGRLVC